MKKREAYGHNRATLPLMEQIIMLLVFMLCATVCIRVFTYSHVLSASDAERDRAVITVQSAAELVRATGADYDEIVKKTGGEALSDGVYAYYDKDFCGCEKDESEYTLRIKKDGGTDLLGYADIWLQSKDGEEIFKVRAAFQEGLK
ncbi:MAG: hypothetical protein K6E56_04040 [Lachnospiraceae bacterium]|nr:hypothetical protein [Lachnospiraceae bacterium]